MSEPSWNPRALTVTLLAIALILAWLLVLLLTSAATQATAARVNEPLRPAVMEIEPNDVPEQANSIPINENMLGTIPLTNASDIDYFVLTTEFGSNYEVGLEEWPPSANHLLRLSLYNSEKMHLGDEYTSGGDAVLEWTADGTTFYLSVDAIEIDLQDSHYVMRVQRIAVPNWDNCEINDSLTGTWSPTAPPGGPCPISVGQRISDLNFVPFTGQPWLNPDVFQVWLKEGYRYSIETYVTPGVDTHMFLYAPGATDASQLIAANDDKSASDWGSRIEWDPSSDGTYIVVVINRYPLAPAASRTYELLVTGFPLFRAYLPIVVKSPSSR